MNERRSGINAAVWVAIGGSRLLPTINCTKTSAVQEAHIRKTSKAGLSGEAIELTMGNLQSIGSYFNRKRMGALDR
jgi:hypothetical protein